MSQARISPWKAAWNGKPLTQEHMATIQREQCRIRQKWGFHRKEVEKLLKRANVGVKMRTRFSFTPDQFLVCDFYFPQSKVIAMIDTGSESCIDEVTMSLLKERRYSVVEYPKSSVFWSPKNLAEDLVNYIRSKTRGTRGVSLR